MNFCVKSVTDVITNSSSETYIIRNRGNAKLIETLWLAYLANFAEEHGTPENPSYSCVYNGFDVTDKDDGSVELDYTVLCNVEDCYGKLCTLFGKENIEDISWG